MESSEEWVIFAEHPGYKVKTVKHGSCTIEIFRPILDELTREKVEAQVKTVAGATLREYYIRMEREKNEQQNHN